jgi:hypothetical protein
VLCPSRQQECLLRALGLLPPGIAFLAQVLYLVFSVMEQQQRVARFSVRPCERMVGILSTSDGSMSIGT